MTQEERAALSADMLELQGQLAALEQAIAEIRAKLDAPEPDPEPEPEPDPDPEPEDPEEPIEPLPGDGEKIRIADGAALTKVLAAGGLKPGTVLALHPDGKFPGTYAIRNSGASKEKPIFVVAEQASAGRRTTISGKLVAHGAYLKLSGFDFTGGGIKVEIWGRGVRVNRCRFPDIRCDGIVYFKGGTHAEVQIDRNEFTNIAGAAIRGELKDCSKVQNMRIERNFFNGHSTAGNEAVIMILTDAFHDSHLRVHKNLFRNCLRNNNTGQGEIISVKTGGVGITDNTFEGTTGYIALRETNRCRVSGNWLDSKSYFKVFGDDHVMTNNHGENIVLELNSGDAYATDKLPSQCKSYMKAGRTTIIYDGKCKPAHTATRNGVVADNVGRVIIGNKRAGYNKPCQGLRLRNNAKKAERLDDSVDTVETDVGVANNTAQRLTPTAVGIKAS